MGEAFIVRRGGVGGGKYSLLTVTTEEASFVGETVTVTATGTGAETESYTKTFTAAKSLEFRLKQLTTYTIICGTATQTIVIPYYADYTVAIALDKKLYTNGTQDVPWTVSGQDCREEETYLLYHKGDDNGYTVRTVMTSNKINTTGFTKLRIKAYVESAGGTTISQLTCRFGLYDNNDYESYTNCTINVNPKGSSPHLEMDENDVDLDISSYQGEYYVGICTRTYARSAAQNVKVQLKEIWLE